MPRDAADTRRRLLDVAQWLFAEKGIARVSLSEINIGAGQRNSSAVQYHFGAREGILRAILERHVSGIREQRHMLLAQAGLGSSDDGRLAVEAYVRPLADLLGGDWRDRAFLRIVAELATDLSRTVAEVRAIVGDTAGGEANRVLFSHFSPLPEQLMEERRRLAEMMVLHTLADRARLIESGAEKGNASDLDLCVANLVDMYHAAAVIPPSEAVLEILPSPAAP